MESLIGKTIGTYEILAEVGRGGMAVVYKAYQRALDRYVAIKVLPPQFTFDPEFVRRFALEARAAAKLKHPNIVTIYDVGEQNGIHYIVEEFVEGITLAELIHDEGALPPARAANIIAQVASALDYAHALGFIHRDVKPSNIMIGANDHATLTDFGIAKAAEGTRVTKSGMMVGTPEYMAPEQIRGQAVDGRVDVYALGVVGYEMLAGRVPFQGDTARVLYGQVHEAPPPLRSLNPRVPAAAEVALGMALAKEPAQRYARAGDFANALTAAVSGGVAVQPPAPEAPTRYVSPPPPPPRQTSAPLFPVLAGIAGAVVLLCVVLAIAVMARQPNSMALAPTSTTVASASPTAVPTSAPTSMTAASRPSTAVPTATPLVIVVTATPIPTPTATATPPSPQKRLDAVTYKYEDGRDYTSAVEIFDLNTGSRSRFYQVAQGQHISSAVWSRDGKKILIAWFGLPSESCPFFPCGGGIQSMMVDSSGKEIIAISRAAIHGWGGWRVDWMKYFDDAIWSPDQQKIAVVGTDPVSNRCPSLLDTRTLALNKLPSCEAYDYPRYWSVDGKWIIAWSERGLKLYAYEVDGNRRVPLEQLGKIQVYDQRYWPWRVTDAPVCKGASFWECE